MAWCGDFTRLPRIAQSRNEHVTAVRVGHCAADGDEGGRHQLINAAVSNGNLYILKVQIGDKRWFKVRKLPGGLHACHTSVAQVACMRSRRSRCLALYLPDLMLKAHCSCACMTASCVMCRVPTRARRARGTPSWLPEAGMHRGNGMAHQCWAAAAEHARMCTAISIL